MLYFLPQSLWYFLNIFSLFLSRVLHFLSPSLLFPPPSWLLSYVYLLQSVSSSLLLSEIFWVIFSLSLWFSLGSLKKHRKKSLLKSILSQGSWAEGWLSHTSFYTKFIYFGFVFFQWWLKLDIYLFISTHVSTIILGLFQFWDQLSVL